MRDVDADAAFDLMRQYARRHHLRLSDVAKDIVHTPSKHPELTGGS
jgi:AmiR/NasT family two-component response regulator